MNELKRNEMNEQLKKIYIHFTQTCGGYNTTQTNPKHNTKPVEHTQPYGMVRMTEKTIQKK